MHFHGGYSAQARSLASLCNSESDPLCHLQVILEEHYVCAECKAISSKCIRRAAILIAPICEVLDTFLRGQQSVCSLPRSYVSRQSFLESPRYPKR